MWRKAGVGEVGRGSMRNDTLLMGFGSGTRLIPLGGNRYRQRQTGTEFVFNEAVTPATLTVRTGGGPVVYTRMAAVTLTAAQLAEYAGQYVSPELETTWAIAADSGNLVVRINGRRSGAPWEPAYRDAFG